MSSRLVLLRDGFCVTLDAYLLALQLEQRGITLRRDGMDLVVLPAAGLTADDYTRLRTFKPDLLRLVDYCTRIDLDQHLFTDLPRREHAHA